MQNHKKWRGGFTLVEILVVLAVVAIISSISFGAFRSVTEGNKRTNCQSNLSQIYKSARLYAQDYDGRFPYLNAGGAPNQPETPANGIGLWALYAFPKPGAQNCTPDSSTGFNTDYNTDLDLPGADNDGIRQLAGYVKSAKIFHCPADRFSKSISVRTSPTACSVIPNVPTASFTATVPGVDGTYINPAYLSYQYPDDVGKPPISTLAPPQDTYSSFRQSGPPVRQLTPYIVTSGVTSILERPTRDMTVLTWCRFHRSLNNEGNTVNGQRNFDNVLFSDGSVQSLPASQEVKVTPTSPVSPDPCVSWQRVPREKADTTTSSPSDCTPSP